MRLDPKDRKDAILTAALAVAQKPGGWSNLTRQAVAAEAKCADALVSKYFGTMIAFRRSIMRAAIINKNKSVIAQGVASGDKHAVKAVGGQRAAREAMASLTA